MGPIESRRPAVTQPVTMYWLADEGPRTIVQAELRFDQSDPYAVSIALAVASRPVVWTFARDLFAEGVHQPAGDGDVHVWSGRAEDFGEEVVFIELSTADEDAILAAAVQDVVDFLEATNRVVPVGDESRFLDVDAAILAILATAATGCNDD